MKKGYGRFGNLSKNYRKARKDFPDEAIAFIFAKLNPNPQILDIGCGTGIATEQLHERGTSVVGTDVDPEMIEEAKEINPHGIKYYVAPAEKQPFRNSMFDAVTAFSAFHWFTHKKALEEIRRVLKPGGLFFAINKNETGDFKKSWKAVMKRYIGQPLPDAKKDYDPHKILEKDGFLDLEEKIILVSEYFTLDEVIAYMQSVSMFNLIPKDKRLDALQALKVHFKNTTSDLGLIERQLEVAIVCGRNGS